MARSRSRRRRYTPLASAVYHCALSSARVARTCRNMVRCSAPASRVAPRIESDGRNVASPIGVISQSSCASDTPRSRTLETGSCPNDATPGSKLIESRTVYCPPRRSRPGRVDEAGPNLGRAQLQPVGLRCLGQDRQYRDVHRSVLGGCGAQRKQPGALVAIDREVGERRPLRCTIRTLRLDRHDPDRSEGV